MASVGSLPRCSVTASRRPATGFAQGEEVFVPTVWVGTVRLSNVDAVVCDSCAALMGQTLLARFNLKTTRINSMDFLALSPRS
jgi:predicted aspartyl protease